MSLITTLPIENRKDLWLFISFPLPAVGLRNTIEITVKTLFNSRPKDYLVFLFYLNAKEFISRSLRSCCLLDFVKDRKCKRKRIALRESL